jgi:hypothetical protein
MTPKEKAEEIIQDFYNVRAISVEYGMEYQMAKQCAIIAVDEIIKSNPCEEAIYWLDVKREIKVIV